MWIVDGVVMTFLWILGFVFLNAWVPLQSFPRLFVSAMYLPTGAVLSVMGTAGLLFTTGSMAPGFIVGIYGLLFMGSLFYMIRNGENISSLFFKMDGLVFIANGFLVFAFIQKSTLTFDSLCMLEISRDIYNSILAHQIIMGGEDGLLSFPLFAPALHFLGVLFGKNHLDFIHPLLSINLTLAVFALLQYLMNRLTNLSKQMAFCISCLPFLLLYSSYFNLYQLFYINGHLWTGLYIALSFVTFWCYLIEQKPVWLFFSCLGLTAYCFLRIESPLFTAVFLTLLFSQKAYRIEKKHLYAFLFWIGFIFTIWNLFLQVAPMDGGAFDRFSIAIMNVLLWSSILCLIVFRANYFVVFRNLWPYLICIASLLVLGMVSWVMPSHIQTCIQAIEDELLGWLPQGYWGYIWWEVFLLYFYVVFTRSDFSFEKSFLCLLPLYITIIVLLGSMRNVYHVSPFDSANRMMTHILPVLLVFFTVKIAVRLWPIHHQILADEKGRQT